MKIFFSIIIPFNYNNDFLIENISKLNNQSYKNFELILVSNELNTLEFIKKKTKTNFKIKHIFTKQKEPSYKRNLAAKSSTGEYLAFIDDDAYPHSEWLNVAYENIINKKMNIFGGPSLTPDTDGFIAKLSSFFYESKIGGGSPERYTSKNNLKYVEDWPSVNFFVEKNIFKNIGGFEEKIWPGEDTYFCEKLKNLNYKIYYLKNLIVYHHRRNSIFKHLKQLFNYGFNRAYLIKNKYIKLKFKNTLPMMLNLYLIFLAFFYFLNNDLFKVFIFPLYIYFVLTLVYSLRILKMKFFFSFLLFPLLVFISHISYGLGFIYSLIKNKYILLER